MQMNTWNLEMILWSLFLRGVCGQTTVLQVKALQTTLHIKVRNLGEARSLNKVLTQASHGAPDSLALSKGTFLENQLHLSGS